MTIYQLRSETLYEFAVLARNRVGDGLFSEIVTARTKGISLTVVKAKHAFAFYVVCNTTDLFCFVSWYRFGCLFISMSFQLNSEWFLVYEFAWRRLVSRVASGVTSSETSSRNANAELSDIRHGSSLSGREVGIGNGGYYFLKSLIFPFSHTLRQLSWVAGEHGLTYRRLASCILNRNSYI